MKTLNSQSFQTSYILWRGRHHHDDLSTSFYYTASGFDIKLHGSILKATIDSSYEEIYKKAYLTIEIYGKNHQSTKIIDLNQGTHTYTLFEGLQDTYTISIYKRSEELMSITKLIYLDTDGTFFEQNEAYQLKIEFVGDSLTCGYGNMSNDVNQQFDTSDEDGLKSFASIAAKRLDAYYEIIAVSGIGLYKSIYAKETLPSIYDYHSVHDHRLYTQQKVFDLIVVMLGTNDNSYMKFLVKPSYDYEKTMFEKQYNLFIEHLRKKQPKAKILCLYQKEKQNLLYENIIQAVKNSKDDAVYALELPEIEKVDGMGAQYHPTIKTHEKWGLIVAQYIKDKNENLHT